MRQLSFLVLFGVLLGIAFFTMQNAEPTLITLFPGLTFQSPLGIELLVAAGLGASFAWFYTLWMKMQLELESRQKTRELNKELKEKQDYISELQQMLGHLESRMKQLPPTLSAEAREEKDEQPVSQNS